MAVLDQEFVTNPAERLPSNTAAKRYISLLQEVIHPNEEQKALLAAAHYTLSTEKDISTNISKMHINAAIALLKRISISKQNKHWSSQIAHAYFKRAEILEDKNIFNKAAFDYLKSIEMLERSQNNNQHNPMDDEDHLLLAQSAISIADLIVSEQIEPIHSKFSHPLFYVNKALEHLAKLKKTDDKVFSTYAYAHQIAGIALSSYHFEESREAFRVALLMAFKTESSNIPALLSDIYTCLGLLYEDFFQKHPSKYQAENTLDYAIIYFSLSQLLSPIESEDNEENLDGLSLLENMFELIYRVLDPYLPSLPYQITCDLIDTFIYIYVCFIDGSLPNQVLKLQLEQTDILDAYAQHIYLLVLEAYKKKHPRSEGIDIFEYTNLDFKLKSNEIFDLIQSGRSDNVYYLPFSKIN